MTCPFSTNSTDEVIIQTTMNINLEAPMEERSLESYKLPPGPGLYSDRGDFILNEQNIYKKMVQLYVPEYGSLVTMYKDGVPMVIVNNIDEGYDIFVRKHSKAVSGRQATYGEKILSGNRNNILNSDYGPMWKVLQRNLHKGLRQCAKLGRLDEIMYKCFDQLKDSIEWKKGSKKGGTMIEDDMFWTADNVITVLLFNEILKDNEYKSYQDSIKVIPKYAEKCDFPNGKPSTESEIKAVQDLQKAFDQLSSILQKRIDDHRQKGDYKIACFDITDFVLRAVEEYHMDPRVTKLGVELTDLHAKHSLIDVIFASQEGLGNSFVWVIGLLTLHPEIQENIRREMSKFRDDNKTKVTLRWKSKMPYTNAVLCEMQRLASANTMTDIHVTMDDLKIGIWEIPKNSMIVLNLYAIHHDINRWLDPEKLNPQRFLSEEGKTFHRRKDFVPYGLGLRTCVGNTFAENVLFMLIMLILDNFRLVWGENESQAIMDDSDAVFIRDVVPFKVQFISIK